MTTDPTMDIAQQKLPLFDRDAELQDPGVASFVEVTFYKNKGFGTTCKPSSYHLVRRQRVMEEVGKVERSLVDQRVGLYHWILFKLYDLRAKQSHRLASPRG